MTEPGVGRPFPLGATLSAGGVNFSVFSKNATGIELLLFAGPEDPEPARIIQLDPRQNRTYHYWHVFVPGVTAGQIYAYRAKGPFEPRKGLRFDPEKVLMDPYGRAVVKPKTYTRRAATLKGGNASAAIKSVVADLSQYDWEGDVPLRRPFSKTVIYEMHVRGFTRHPSSGVAPEKRGTYAGLIEKIPYLQDLGVTAVELLPVFEFDEGDAAPGLINYWGYSPISFLRPTGLTAGARISSAPWMNSGTWSRRCTGQASRSSWMSCTTTRRRATTRVRRSVIAAWRTTPTICWRTTKTSS